LDEPPSTLAAVAASSIAAGALFTALTSALDALGSVTLRAIAESESSLAGVAQRVLERGPELRDRLLVARIACVSTAAAASVELARSISPAFVPLGGLIAVLVYASVAQLGASIARRRASRVALHLVRILRPLELALVPFTIPVAVVRRLVERFVPEKEPPAEVSERIAELAVEQVIEQGEVSGSITEDHAELLWNVLEFEHTVAREIMVPRTRVVAFAVDTPIKDVLAGMADAQHSRYPVYRGTIDNVVGTLVAKDLFRAMTDPAAFESVKLAEIVRRPAFFVAEVRKISDVLRAMQSKRIHLAIVTDEFGGTSGVVTIEDVLEEIVGEIQDEHDEEEHLVREVEKGRFLVQASASLDELTDWLDERVSDEDVEGVDSIGGLVTHIAGRVPEAGETIELANYEAKVVEADERHVVSLELRRRQKTGGDDDVKRASNE
jgi:CBS domain containing-hemolysin-like protein